MNVKTVARLINAGDHTVRRWTAEYHQFLTEGAAPEPGTEREFSAHDLKVLNYVALARKNKRMHEDIKGELETMQRQEWAALPNVPEEWLARSEDGLMPVAEAGERGQLIAENAALQVRTQTLAVQLLEAQERADTLQLRLDDALVTQRVSETEITDLKVQLADARGQVNTLKAQLSSYSIRGEKPVPLLILVGAVIVLTVIVTLLVFVLARLLM